MPQLTPTLVYDGECGICRYWVDYWRTLTGEQVVFRPYQEAAADFPAIPQESFPQAIQLIEADGKVYSGAAASPSMCGRSCMTIAFPTGVRTR